MIQARKILNDKLSFWDNLTNHQNMKESIKIP